MRALVLALASVLLLPATAAAQKVEDTFFNSIIPARVDHLIGFSTTTFAIHPVGKPVVPISVRVGGRSYRFIFGNAAAAGGPSANIYLKHMISGRRYPSPQGIFVDRRLTANERRYVTVRADLARDADVLIAARNHPACATGVSRAALRGIVTGGIRTWSAAGVPPPASGDAIALRRAGQGIERFVEPRFGAGGRLPLGAKAAFDGGLREAASGSFAVAGVTSWSRARQFSRSTCVIPVGGAAIADASVRALSHPDAYPITFVTVRNLTRPRDRYTRAITAAFMKYLTGDRASGLFRQRGMLLLKDTWPPLPEPPPPPPPPQPAPEQPPAEEPPPTIEEPPPPSG